MKRTLTIAFLTISVMSIGLLLSSSSDTEKVVTETTDDPNAVAQKIKPIKLPADLSFAGEAVPIDIPDVRERMDREMLVNTYWHSNSIQLFKRANRSFPVIEKILAEEGVPDDFKYLALAESGLLNVTSPARAEGVWQFLKGTGQEYGLEVNSEVDERRHLELATKAATGYLKEAKERFGNWTLAAASYNIGKPRLSGIIEDQKVTSYYDLYLNDETARYVFRIIAMKELFNNPERYGFMLSQEDMYHPYEYRIAKVDSAINNLPAFAIEQGTNYKTLKILNPWLRKPYLYNKSKKTYEIKLPL